MCLRVAHFLPAGLPEPSPLKFHFQATTVLKDHMREHGEGSHSTEKLSFLALDAYVRYWRALPCNR